LSWDLGAGTGLLSFFAAQAGARHVYAIEMSGIAEVAAELIEANGFRDRITLIRKTSKKVRSRSAATSSLPRRSAPSALTPRTPSSLSPTPANAS